MRDPLIVHAANRGEVLVEDSRGNTVPGWLLNVRGNKVRVCFCNGESGTIPRDRIRVPVSAGGYNEARPAVAVTTPAPNQCSKAKRQGGPTDDWR